MARSIVWPAAPEPQAPAPSAPQPLPGLDAASIAATFGPEISRLAGIRISARAMPVAPPASGQMLHICRLRLKAAEIIRAIDIDLPATTAAQLMERLFGGSASQSATASVESLTLLPPGSGSWATLCGHLAQALTRAFEASGLPAGGGPILPPRAVIGAASPTADFALALDIDGTAAALHFTVEPLPVAQSPETPPDPALWRRRAQARTFDVELPVTLRLTESRVALASVAPLRAGDILPLERPRTLDLLVDGRRIGRLPAEAFLPPDTNPSESDGTKR